MASALRPSAPAAFVAAASLLIATLAEASFYDHWGHSPRAVARGGAVTADATDFTATYYNPAMLVLRRDINFGFAFDHARTDARVERSTFEKPLDCTYCDPLDWSGYDVGLLFPLAGKVKNRLALGLGLHLPSTRLVSTRAPDPNRPFWYMWHNDPDRIVVFLGAGIRITDRFTVGVGTQALADLVGNGAAVRVDLFAREVRFREIDSHLATTFGPTAGAYFEPLDGLRFGLNYRSQMRLFYSIPADITLEGIGQLNLIISGYNHFTPHTVTAGVAWDPLPELTLSLDANYQTWSRAPSPYVRIQVDLSGDTLAALGLDEAMDLDTRDVDSVSPGLKDTVTTRVGAEYRVSDRFAARAGLFYRPTPVPRQNASLTNILDGNALGVSGGIGFSFADPLEVFAEPIIIDVGVQGIWLLPRQADKHEADDVPSYRYSMRVLGTSAAVRYNF